MRQRVLVSLQWLIDPSLISFIFLDVNPENSWALKEGAKKVADVFQKYIKANLERLKTGVWSFGGLFGSFIHTLAGQRDNSDRFLQSLLNEAPADMTVDQLTYNIFGLIVASVANWAAAAAHVINFYFDEQRAEQKKHIERLVMDRSAEATALLAGYAREALRFDPPTPGIFRDAAQDVFVQDGDHRSVSLKKGERVFVSLAHANMDVSGRSRTLGIRGNALMHIRSPPYLRILGPSTPVGTGRNTILSVDTNTAAWDICLLNRCLLSSISLLICSLSLCYHIIDNSRRHARHLLQAQCPSCTRPVWAVQPFPSQPLWNGQLDVHVRKRHA